MKADIDKSLDAGFRHHLVKPFLPADLDAILHEASET
jgi:CheY-like chemotaxis protein